MTSAYAGRLAEVTGRQKLLHAVCQHRVAPPEHGGGHIHTKAKGAYRPMYQSSVRSTTANSGKTVLALVAILSLLLSLFAVARPVIANHEPPDGPEVTPTAEEFPGGGPSCPTGTTGIRFGDSAEDDGPLTEGSQATVTLIDGSQATVTILSLDNNLLTFEVEGGLAAIVKVKGGVSSPGTNDQNVYDYRGLAGGGIAHDDGLRTPNTQGISHVDFCLVPVEGSLIVYKTDQTQADVPGAEFTVKDGDTVVGGPAGTDANGLVCFDGLVVGKSYSVIETDAPDGWLPADPDTQMVEAVVGSCEDRAGADPDATFTNTLLGSLLIYKTDQTQADVEGAVFTVEGKEGTFTTDANGLFCVDGLVVGDTVTVTETDAPDGWEPADPAFQDVVVAQAGTCADHDEIPDATFTNTLLGSLLVLKVDDGDPVAPLPGAEFSITGPDSYDETATSDANGWFCLDGLTFGAEYTVTETKAPDGFVIGANNPQMHTIDDSMTCEERLAAEGGPVADLIFSNTREDEDTGSITVVKELDCEECETRTIGYYFNTADQHEEETNALFDALGGIEADGILFTNVDQVQQYRADDQDGTSDGQKGLSARGQLTLQYLAATLNVERNGTDCDLASRIYNNPDSPFDGWTVGDILAEADKAFGGTSEYSDEDIKSALDDINNSSHEEENPLSCEGTESGTLDGVKFDLFLEADYPDGEPVATGTTGDDGPGTVIFDGLTLDETYVLVESGFPEGLTCAIVDVKGEGFEFTLNDDGSVTIELTANAADVTLTVVNECEEEEEEEEFGEIEIRKSADDDPEESFAFSATWDTDGFSLMDGDAEFSGDLPAGEEFTVTEELTAEQILGGWSLANIDCGDAEVTVEGNSVTITVVADAVITCTFTNELDEDEENGLVEIDKLFCFTDEEASTEFFVFGPSPLPELDAFGQVEEPEDGCWTEAVSFTITGGDLSEPLEVMTDENGILEIELPAGDYVITEDLSGESAAFSVEDGAITTIAVLNLVPEDEAGLVKVIKLFCEGDEASVSFSVEGGNAPTPVISDCEVGDATFELGDLEITTEDGIAIVVVDVGEYTFAETDPNEATYDGTVVVEEGEITTIIVINTFEEGEEPGGGGPGGNETPREGTQGGNPLPNTATSPIPTGSAPAALLALLMLGGLGVASYAVRAEARRRR